MKTILILITLLLAGCATQQEIVQQPPDGEFTLKNPPEMATACVARNIETYAGNILSDRRPTPDGWELIARVMSEGTSIYAIGHFRPAGSGSHLRLWNVRHLTMNKAEVAARLVKGC